MHNYYINVPLNEEAMKAYDYMQEPDNMFSIELTEEEFQELDAGLFHDLNRELSVMIQFCEDERIETEQIEQALHIARIRLAVSTRAREKSGLEKVLQALQIAQRAKTYLAFDF